jgi:hypothetical protein
MQNIYYHHQLLLYQSQLQQQQLEQLPQQLAMAAAAAAGREKLRGYSVPNLGGVEFVTVFSVFYCDACCVF